MWSLTAVSSSELLEKAKRQYEKGNVEGAVSSLETITEEYPSLIAAHYSLGLIGLLSGDANRAIKYACARVCAHDSCAACAYTTVTRERYGPVLFAMRGVDLGPDCACRPPQAQPEGRGAFAWPHGGLGEPGRRLRADWQHNGAASCSQQARAGGQRGRTSVPLPRRARTSRSTRRWSSTPVRHLPLVDWRHGDAAPCVRVRRRR